MNQVIYYTLSALATLLILTVHEYAHAYAAYKLGDGTAKAFGRLTLNPLKHLDPLGAICMVLFHFGWAKPVPINPRNFKNPKRDFAISALAGPLSNMLFAFISAFVYLLLLSVFSDIKFNSEFSYLLAQNTVLFVYIFHIINIGIGIFNLIPIPPLDGSRILNVVLPPKYYFGIMRYERKIYFGLILWLALGDTVKRVLLSVPIIAANPVLSFVAGIFSLSDILGLIFSFVSRGMIDFWQLIPALNF
ncbi:MAG: site-2 protease family protein [Ruminococcaceae bacterium]|nr:site-2 protease family protein [Oscillospiraceae bacterium]